MENEPIVQVYSARDPVEANTIGSLLQRAGIQATVVGESVNQLAGSVPFGGVSSPRVWVPGCDEDKAIDLIKQWVSDRATPEPDAAADEDWGGQEGAEEGAAPDEADDGAGGVSAVGKLLVCAGAALVLVGGVFTWFAYKNVQRCSAEAAADFFYFKERTGSDTAVYNAIYRYQVNGRTYSARIEDVPGGHTVPRQTVVHYDPKNPEFYDLGQMMPAWQPLVFCGSAGLLLMVLAYRIG